MQTIAMTGSTGLIGTRILELLGYKYVFIPILQNEVDITDHESLMSNLKDHHFDFLIHLAAYTNVDGAEKDKELCHSINVKGTQNIADLCHKKHARLIHISTDFVFDGKKENEEKMPIYTEASTPKPISWYGQTKYEAEQIVADDSMIVRLSYPYRKAFEPKRDFVRTIAHMLTEGKTMTMVDDSLITPTYIDDIAYALDHLIENYVPEVFHLVGSDSMSPYAAGLAIAKHYHLDANLIKPIAYETYFAHKALRPQYAQITNTKHVGLKMKSLEEGFKEMDRIL